MFENNIYGHFHWIRIPAGEYTAGKSIPFGQYFVSIESLSYHEKTAITVQVISVNWTHETKFRLSSSQDFPRTCHIELEKDHILNLSHDVYICAVTNPLF